VLSGGRGPNKWPVYYACILSVSYAAIFITYIIVSGRIAHHLAMDAEQLKQIEVAKGVSYGVLSSLLLFAGALTLFRRIAADSEKMAAQKQIASVNERHAVTGLLTMGIAHDCNNLVAILTNSLRALQALERDVKTDELFRSYIERIDSSVKVLHQILSRLHKAGRQMALGKPETVNLEHLVEKSVTLCKDHHSFGNTAISVSIEPDLSVTGYGILIQQILINLIINACEATAGAGVLKIAGWKEANWALLEIHDNGPGIPMQIQEAMFQPYYSTKKEGLGLGLVSVKACIDSNKGELTIADSPLGGACFRIKIPLPVA
jgi:signal transduction histidine kinase